MADDTVSAPVVATVGTECIGWTCMEAGQPVISAPLSLPPLGETEVQVKVKFCGLCASDVSAYGYAAFLYQFPLVAGHEGVGEVVALGSRVRHRKVGDRVGLGIYRNSCGDCAKCAKGKDNMCKEKKLMFTEGKSGALGELVNIDERYAVPIPDSIPYEAAGPLMCAGQTVFAPFVEHNIRPGDRVGIVGIGGLGHLALKFSTAMGCITTAFSRSDRKKAEAEGFGARLFVATGDPDQVEAAKASQDYILMTAGGSGVDWDQLFGFLDVGGKIIVMGFSGGGKPIPVPYFALVSNQSGICGSAGGSLHVTRTMLEFAAQHNITPQIEVFPVDRINDAIQKVNDGSIRYRAVLKFD